MTFRSFVGNFVGNFVDAMHVRGKAVKLGRFFDKVPDEVPDKGQHWLTSLNKYQGRAPPI